MRSVRLVRARVSTGGPRGRSWLASTSLVGLWGLGLLLAGASPLAAQVSVEDLEMHLQLKKDTVSLTQLVPVKNLEGRAQQVRVTVGDWYRDSVGSNVFSETGTVSAKCGPGLKVFPTTFQIAPGATEFVRVTYTPKAADPGCWAIVFFETILPPAARPEAQGSFLSLEIRTGVKVYVHAVDAQRAGSVESADVGLHWRPANPGVSRDSAQVREATVLFANTGTEHLRVRSTLEIRDAQGQLLRTIEGNEAPMVPGSARYIAIRLPDLAAGDYVAVILLDYGGDEIAAAQVEFKVP